MDYNRFQEIVMEEVIRRKPPYDSHVQLDFGERYTRGSYYPRSSPQLRGTFVTYTIHKGGSEGGNCWVDGASRPYSNVVTYTDFDVLNHILMAVNPEISLSDAMTVCGLVTETSDETERGYYGNYAEYSYIEYNVERLYKELLDRNLLPDQTPTHGC